MIPEDQYAFDLSQKHYLLFAVATDGTAPSNASLTHKHTGSPIISVDSHTVSETFSIAVNGSSKALVVSSATLHLTQSIVNL